MNSVQHLLSKSESGWTCSVCQWNWKGKPRAECPGVRWYTEQPEELVSERNLLPKNLKPSAPPVGCIQEGKVWIWLYDPQQVEMLYPYPIVKRSGIPGRDQLATPEQKTEEELQPLNRSVEGVTPAAMMWRDSGWQFLYQIDDCPIADPNLPPIYPFNQRPEHLKSPSQLPPYNLKPGTAPPRGCYWHPQKGNWVYLYDPDGSGFEVLDPMLPTCYPSKSNAPIYLKDKGDLKLLNLQINEDAQPQGCYRMWESSNKYGGEWRTIFLYSVEDCTLVDPTLPTCYLEQPEDLKTEKELADLNLAPKDAPPCGCLRRYWYNELQTIPLWHPDDCQWSAKDNYICKTTLRRTYLLSERWIEQLGEPDRSVSNPHHERWSPMQLYSRQRVESFLAQNAEAYAVWLDERDRFVAIFEQHREAIQVGRRQAIQIRREQRIAEFNEQLHRIRAEEDILSNRLRGESDQVLEQSIRCLQCASGSASPNGYLCVVHPYGLDAHQFPCPDWSPRQGEG